MKEYHKIQTVFLRDPDTNNKFLLEGQWARPEFEFLANLPWEWTEKVNGTNIRILWNNREFQVRGKTDNAQIPVPLRDYLMATFTEEKLDRCFPNENEPDGSVNITLYGEGFGARIQKGGGNYNPDGVGFALFDVYINGVWLERANIEDIAGKLEIPHVPLVGVGTLSEAIDHARTGFKSAWGDFKAEGLVCRPQVGLLNRLGRRVITKIKTKDFPK